MKSNSIYALFFVFVLIFIFITWQLTPNHFMHENQKKIPTVQIGRSSSKIDLTKSTIANKRDNNNNNNNELKKQISQLQTDLDKLESSLALRRSRLASMQQARQSQLPEECRQSINTAISFKPTSIFDCAQSLVKQALVDPTTAKRWQTPAFVDALLQFWIEKRNDWRSNSI
jgi:predicted RND superfamily exporter protein